MTTITLLPPAPSRADPLNFADVADTFVAALPAFGTEANAVASEINAFASTASTAASTASTQAGIATTQATNAATSASTASTQATNASTSATTATTQAGIATTQATNAATSASTATTQAGIASTKAVEAAASAAAASAIVLGVSTNHPTIRPSLNLDFANSQVVDPRITFTRASTATRTNNKGLIESVASGTPRIDYDPVTGACKGLLIEESRVNLLTYSEQCDNAAWSKVRSTITANATTAPDGTSTADKLVEDTAAANDHYIIQGYGGYISGATYTLSVFAKAGERSTVQLWLGAALFADGITRTAKFNLTTGTVGATTGSPVAGIAHVGGGWHRCSMTFTATVTTGQNALTRLCDASGNDYYTGDGTSGIFLWGAQLEAGAFATSYQPSTETWTARASTATFYGSNGLIQTAGSGVARMNYNPMNLTVAPKLLLEAAATNLLTYSEQFDNAAWTKTRSSITANAVTAPDGTTTADKLVEDATASNTHQISATITKAASAAPYTVFVFAKADTRTQITLVLTDFLGNDVAVLFDLSTGVAVAPVTQGTFTGASASTVQLPNGWWICRLTVTSSTSTTLAALMRLTSAGLVTYTGDGVSGLYLWGAQLEAGAFATSYIPTVASQVTRVADSSTSAQTTRAADVASMTGTNFSSWYRQDEGSFVETNILGGNAASQEIIQVNDGTANEAIAVRYSSGSLAQFSVTDGGVSQCSIAPAGFSTIGSTYKRAVAYKINDFAQSINGGAVSTDASGTLPTVTQMVLGTSLNGHLSNVAYYPKRVTNTELQALSTQ